MMWFTLLSRALRRNVGYKILSVVIAILLYAVALAQQNPVTKAEVYVEPSAENLPSGMVLQSGPSGGPVVVSGPAKAVDEFRSQAIKATVDLSHATAGFNRLSVRYRTAGRPLEITGLPFSEIRLEKKTNMAFVVDILHDDAAPAGYDFEEPVASPSRVSVSGLPDDVGRVDRVVAFVGADAGSLGGGERTVPADLVAQNIKRQVIEGVEIDPPTVQVKLRLKKALSTKSVLLSAQITGTHGARVAVVGYTFNPPMVTVSGTPARLAALSSLSVPLDVEGMTKSQSKRVRLPLPSGVSLVKPTGGFADVRIDVEPVQAPVLVPTPVPSPTATPDKPNVPRPITPTPVPSASPAVPTEPGTQSDSPDRPDRKDL